MNRTEQDVTDLTILSDARARLLHEHEFVLGTEAWDAYLTLLDASRMILKRGTK